MFVRSQNSARIALAALLLSTSLLPWMTVVHAHAEGSETHLLSDRLPVEASTFSTIEAVERHAHIWFFGNEVHIALPSDAEDLPANEEAAIGRSDDSSTMLCVRSQGPVVEAPAPQPNGVRTVSPLQRGFGNSPPPPPRPAGRELLNDIQLLLL